LAKRLEGAIPHANDTMTKVHLQDCQREVELILKPKD
jgi:hypothetical protein